MTLAVALIRHGQVHPDDEPRLIGTVDGPIGDDGARMIAGKRAAGKYPDADIVYTSGLRRCVETAKLIYFSRNTIFTENGFRAPDYGDFDGRNFSELANDEAFIKWQASAAMTACPNGEEPGHFSLRVLAAFQKVCGYAASEGFLSIAVVSHRTVICEILRRYYAPRSKYVDWEVPPGSGYLLRYDTETLTVQIAGNF